MKKFSIVLALLCFVFTSNGQHKYLQIIKENQNEKFDVIVKKVEDYYKDKEKGRGSGYKQFKRWEFYNSTRLSEDGKLHNKTGKTWDEYYKFLSANGNGYAPVPAAGNWISKGPSDHFRFGAGYNGGIGRVNVVTVDPSNSNRIYVGTPGGGLWRSYNNGATWAPLTDGLTHIGISGIAIDPTSPVNNRTIYILTGDGDGGDTRSIGVMKSINNGNTWLSTGLTWTVGDNKRGHKLIMHPTNSNILMAAMRDGIYRTTNGGVTWVKEVSGSFCDIEFRPGTPWYVYASTTNGRFYRSLNTGASWTQISTGLPANSSRTAIAVSPANASYIYLVYGNSPSSGTFGGVYRSTNNGGSFSLRSTTPNILGYSNTGNDNSSQGWYDLAIAVSPTNVNLVHVGGINTWRSTNGGATWANMSYWREDLAGPGDYTHADIHTLEYFGNIIYCGSDGGIYKSTNHALDWTDISSGLRITQFYRIGTNKSNANIIAGGAQDNGSNRWNYGSFYHWYGADGFESIADPLNPQTFYGSTQNGGLVKTTNNGTNVTGIKPAGAGSGAWLTPYVMHAAFNNTLYAGYTDVFRSFNGGTTWTNISNGNIGGGKCATIAVAKSNSNYIYTSKGSTLYRTTNSGGAWSIVSGTLPNSTITSVAINPANPNIVYVTFGGYINNRKVYRTTNGGTSWTNLSVGLPNLPANTIVYQEGSNDRIYVGMDVGVYYRDNSTGWTAFNNGLPNVEIFELEINYQTFKIRAATYGRGIWESTLHYDCMPTFTLTYPVRYRNSFLAEKVVGKSIIYSKSRVKFYANKEVNLKPGFRVVGDNFFQAIVRADACDGVFLPYARNEVKEITGTYGGPMPGLVVKTDVEEKEVFASSSDMVLTPNPSAGQTNLHFTLEQKGKIEITIYDLMGKRVKTIVDNQTFGKGAFNVNIDLTDHEKGVYICTLKNGSKVETKKLIVE